MHVVQDNDDEGDTMTKDPMNRSGGHLATGLEYARKALQLSDAGNRAGALEMVLAAEQLLSDARHALVAELRNSGSSWPELGALLGISKQGAAKVYDEDSARLMNAEARYRRELRDAERATEVAAGPELVELPAPSDPVAAPAVDVPLDLEPLLARVRATADDERPFEYADVPANFPRTGIWGVVCPTCGGDVGEPCNTSSGAWTRNYRPHASRAHLAGVPTS